MLQRSRAFHSLPSRLLRSELFTEAFASKNSMTLKFAVECAGQFEGNQSRCYNQKRSVRTKSSFLVPPKLHVCNPTRIGQVAQSVERSPEKAGVGGSIPSLATITP